MRSLLAITILLASVSLPAEASTQHLADDTIRRHDLGGARACLAFVDARAVEYRKDRWRRAIDELWAADPDAVLAWIVGDTAPPLTAVAEAMKQRDCLVERLVHDAADPATRLILDFQKQISTKASMPSLGQRFRSSPAFRQTLRQTLTESDYRNASTQSWIWKRKFVFSGRNFNYVSQAAGERCGIEPLESWKPDDRAHRRCWEDALTGEEKEREILLASAAPGISRHHWGTDFDFFGLNPVFFRTGRFADEYLWMTQNAIQVGFFQPYASRETQGHRYMEERWHWSYYPIAQALLEFAADHSSEVGEALEVLWTGLEARWNAGRPDARPFFAFVREHWREFMFGVDSAVVRHR